MAHSNTKYPTEFPVDEIRHCIDLVRNGDILTEKAEFAKDVWVAQGYLQYAVLGEPGAEEFVGATTGVAMVAPPGTTLPKKVKTEDDAISVLEAVVDSRMKAQPEGVAGAIPIPPELINAAVAWLVQKLLELLSKRN